MTLLVEESARPTVVAQSPGEKCAAPVGGRTLAAAAPLSARVDPMRIRRHWLSQRWEETPSWLTSLVFHMTLVIVLGSLTLGAMRTRQRAAPLLLTVAEAAGQPETEPEVLIEPEPVDEGTHDGVTDIAPQVEDPVTGPSEPIDQSPPDQPERDEPGEIDDQPVLKDVQRAATAVLLADVAGIIRPGSSSQVDADAIQQQQHSLDEVVERFIEFDIGRLRGEEAQAARRAFSQLGEDAIPALVRGLNRSAYISASCPVVVISRKLTKSLDNTADPRSLQYAIDNLGRDVPVNAPHARVLRSVRAQALAIQQKRARYQEMLDAGRDITWNEFKQLENLSAQQPGELARGLRSPDDDTRLAALLAIGLRAPRVADRLRMQMGRDVSELLDDADPRIREEARIALANLAPEAAPTVDARTAPHRATRWWRRYWAEFEREKVAVQAARNQYRMAKSLADAGKLDAAKRRFRKLRQQYPDTEAAADATRELHRLGEL